MSEPIDILLDRLERARSYADLLTPVQLEAIVSATMRGENTDLVMGRLDRARNLSDLLSAGQLAALVAAAIRGTVMPLLGPAPEPAEPLPPVERGPDRTPRQTRGRSGAAERIKELLHGDSGMYTTAEITQLIEETDSGYVAGQLRRLWTDGWLTREEAGLGRSKRMTYKWGWAGKP